MSTYQKYKYRFSRELTDVKVLWHNDWYDGPICGICRYNGLLCYYYWDGNIEVPGQPDEYHWPRKYSVIVLPFKYRVLEYARHWLFKLTVPVFGVNTFVGKLYYKTFPPKRTPRYDDIGFPPIGWFRER